MKKLFISQPMRDKTDEEILAERANAIQAAKDALGEDVEVLDSFFGTSNMSHALEYLGESIKLLAKADIAYFAPGWRKARGCKIEHECAEQYGIHFIEA
jgi:predicted adenine nucleotide alpha hydrolase (AANH) superfamily ATPase